MLGERRQRRVEVIDEHADVMEPLAAALQKAGHRARLVPRANQLDPGASGATQKGDLHPLVLDDLAAFELGPRQRAVPVDR